jgi:phosphoesterase RecJ-like protein
MAATLIEAGVDSEVTWRRIYLNKSQEELELEARARASMEVWADGKIASVALTNQDFVDTGTGPEVTQELVGIPRSLRGAKLAVFFYEIEDGRTTKVSIRSVREIDACALARNFGGGGHRQAAGCSIPAPLAEAKRRFVALAEKMLKSVHF